MEKVYQLVDEKGLQIPMALMHHYGLEKGSRVVLEATPEGIRISPERLDQTSIENRALKYLLTHLGDAVNVAVRALPGDQGWQVDVFSVTGSRPLGVLFFDVKGELAAERSTSPAEIRKAIPS